MIVAFPADNPVTFPLTTVATLGLLVLQLTVLFVASLGETVALSVTLPPTSMAAEVLSRTTPVTGDKAFQTAYSVTLELTCIFCPWTYTVPAPLELVDQPVKRYPSLERPFCPRMEAYSPASYLFRSFGASPVPPLALYLTLKVPVDQDPLTAWSKAIVTSLPVSGL